MSQKISSGIYKSYEGLLVIVALLASVSIMGFVSYFHSTPVLIRVGIGLIIFSMILDLFLVKSNILKKKMYLLHHFVTAGWATFGMFHAEFIAQYRFGILVYMLLGALFRRLWKISKDTLPDRPGVQNSMKTFMVFFDFCDPLVIYFLWDWVQSLPPAHQVCYLGLAVLRLFLNASAYPQIKSVLSLRTIRTNKI